MLIGLIVSGIVFLVSVLLAMIFNGDWVLETSGVAYKRIGVIFEIFFVLYCLSGISMLVFLILFGIGV
jgi:hypothetical protein